MPQIKLKCVKCDFVVSLPHHRIYLVNLHSWAPAVMNILINNSLQALTGAKHVLLAPWEITLLALSAGRLLRKYIRTTLQSSIEGHSIQIPVQPPPPEEQAWMGGLRSIHSPSKFNHFFFSVMDLETFTSWHPKSSWHLNNEAVLSVYCVDSASGFHWAMVVFLHVILRFSLVNLFKWLDPKN